MNNIHENTPIIRSAGLKKPIASITENTLRDLAFDNAAQAHIITTTDNGKIILVNNAACKLLGYSKKELLTKSRTDIFDILEKRFINMLKQRTAKGQSIAQVTAIQKNGKAVPCEITSAIFMDEDGIEKAIFTIADRSQNIFEQKKIDTKKEKIVADNIVLAKSVQKKIDAKNEKIVSHNIDLAISAQKRFDVKKEKIVSHNIDLAKSEQKKIDTEKEKIVADNIVLAKSEQKNIDTKKEKIVADNIIIAQARSDARHAENN
ncbi:MAG: PAS domain-containing protein, partial [Ferruginibacter sp.]